MQTYDDFLKKDLLDWKGNGSDNEIMIDRFIDARNDLNDLTIPSDVIVTEISSLCTYAPNSPFNNCAWKGLHNIQLLLQYGSYPNVLGTMNWVTWYAGGLENTFNVFSDLSETTLSPVGMTLQVLNDHLYSVVDPKIKLNVNAVELTVSHTADFSKMSIFLINKSKSSQSVSFNVNGFIGNAARNTKWIYEPTTLDEWSQDLRYQKSDTTDLKLVTVNTVTVPPLSCTVYDFSE